MLFSLFLCLSFFSLWSGLPPYTALTFFSTTNQLTTAPTFHDVVISLYKCAVCSFGPEVNFLDVQNDFTFIQLCLRDEGSLVSPYSSSTLTMLEGMCFEIPKHWMKFSEMSKSMEA